MTDLERLIESEGDKVVNRDLDLDVIGMESLEYVDQMGYGDLVGQWTYTFWYRYCMGEIKAPFRKSQYYDNEDIIATVEGLGLDVDKFWWVLLLIYDYVEGLFTGSYIFETGSIDKAIQELFKELGADFKDGDIELSIKKGKHNVKVLPVVKSAILDNLRGLYAEYKDRDIRYFMGNLSKERKDYLSASYRIYVTVEQYRELFKYVKTERVKDIDKRVSLNKLLLISRICYLYKYSYNDNFRDSDESLKGILKAYRGRVPRTINSRYL